MENRVPRKIFGPKRDEITEEWRRLHNGELYSLYVSSNIIRGDQIKKIGMVGHVAGMA